MVVAMQNEIHEQLSLAKIIADSLNTETGDRITTTVLPRLPKVLLQEFNTHRLFSRNAASSRAIPIGRMITKIQADPYIPRFTKQKKGMSGIEDNDQFFQGKAAAAWLEAMHEAIHRARGLADLSVHKQHANRLLESFARVPVIVTATEWDNFFNLRCDESAYPDFRETAIAMREAMTRSTPKELTPGEWHIPMFDDSMAELELSYKKVVATARCARVSYCNHDGSVSNLDNDARLHNSLLENGHLSPFEHCAMAIGNHWGQDTRNFRGWYSYRAELEDMRARAAA